VRFGVFVREEAGFVVLFSDGTFGFEHNCYFINIRKEKGVDLAQKTEEGRIGLTARDWSCGY
jgi:hypothetical protein